MAPVLTVPLGLALALAGVRLGYAASRDAAGSWATVGLRTLAGRSGWQVLAGAVAAAALHSSSAVEVAVLTLVQARTLALDDGLFVILGANVGTTVTAQLVALRLPGLGALAMGLGLLVMLVSRRGGTALAIFSLGCFLQGLDLVAAGVGPWVAGRLASLGHAGVASPASGFAWGWLLTSLVQSSTVVSSALVKMAGEGLLAPEVGVAAVLGANVGTVTTGLVASLFVGRGARWLALADFALNLWGAVLALGLFGWFVELLQRLAESPSQVVAHAHTVFNVVSLILAWPLVRPLGRWLASRLG